jgi:DNA-binding winged helix-turn-helix (wHTH) protein
MTANNLAIPDNKLRSFLNEMRLERCGSRLDANNPGAFNQCFLSLSHKDSHWLDSRQGFQHEDYEIALLPRGNRSTSTQQMFRRLDGVFLLSITWRELLEQVGRALSRTSSADQGTILQFGDVRVDFMRMEITRSEKPIALTHQEFKLLEFFMRSPQRAISRGELLNEVWGYNNYPSTRTVDNHICTLRQKLEPNPARPIHFLTVHRIGYKFVPCATE